MPRYEIMKPKHSDFYIGEPVYYSREWYSPKAGAGDIITTDSEPYIEKLKPKTIYIPRKKKPAYLRYTSPRYVRKEPVKIIRSTSNALYPVIHEYKPPKHLKPVEVVRRPYLKHGATFIEDSTSIDENSTSQYSNLSLDVSCDVSAINRDVEALLQQYERVFDDTLITEYEKRITTTGNSQRNLNGNNRKLIKPEKLTSEQLKILSMDKPPLEKLKDIPVQYLKPRLPPYLKEQKKIQPPETKKANELDKSEINTEDLLKELFQDMASKGLTGLVNKPIIKKVEEINITSNEKLISNSNNNVGTQTMNSEIANSLKKNQSTMDEKKVMYTREMTNPPLVHTKQENIHSKYTTYPDLTNLEEFLDKSIKFDLSVSGNELNKNNNFPHKCPNCNLLSNSLKKNGSGDTVNVKDIQTTNEKTNKELNVGKKCEEIDCFSNNNKNMENNGNLESSHLQLTSLRECLSDLTHSRKQDIIDYNNKSNKYKTLHKWQYDDTLLTDNKRLYPSKENSQTSTSTESNETQPFSVKTDHDTIVIESKESLQYQTSSLSGQDSLNMPHTKNVFGLPSMNPKRRSNIPITNRDVTVNTVTSCQPFAGGDNVENQKKILNLLDDIFKEKGNDDGKITSMDSLSEKMAQLDSSLCVEIMRRLTETLIKHQPTSLSSSNVNRSVHLNILKQLRTDHLRHIQQEIKHIEDLDEFLQNFGVNTQIACSRDNN